MRATIKAKLSGTKPGGIYHIYKWYKYSLCSVTAKQPYIYRRYDTSKAYER